ncbi:MAG: hypothetical protein OEZ06_31240 [Myxococcales bacterium]|nr:hypothetical protein [Myxococcales bacterium]
MTPRSRHYFGHSPSPEPEAVLSPATRVVHWYASVERAALGAAPAQILGQFLAEALVLAALGSGVGVVLGMAIAAVMAGQMGWPPSDLADAALGAALFGIGVGTLFGYLPARRAAALDPVMALAKE